MTDKRQILTLSVGNFPVFAAHCLKIRDKSGELIPLQMNRAQAHVHKMLQQQLKETGRVRALVLKGRQQGISTYIAARFYWKTSLNFGRRAFIIAHEQKATDNLFGMVQRYHSENPIAPQTGTTSAKELIFDVLDSGYKLATAGSKDVGRSNTAQYLHASEFAFWQSAAEHLAGIGNSVGDLPGTEIVLESTGNGIGNKFHQAWQDAEAGKGEYLPIFVPWFWQDEYRAAVNPAHTLTEDEAEYKRAYDLNDSQMAWRRNKIITYGTGFEWLFDQEYPATPSLAFRSSTGDPYISPVLVSGAMNSDYRDEIGPLVVGVDPADTGPDRTAIVFRRGRVVSEIRTFKGKNTMDTAGRVAKIISEYKPAAVFVDKIGIGAGIYDRLRELGYGCVIGVLSGAAAQENKIYANKRAEIWGRMRSWMEDSPCRMPNDLELAADLTAPGFKFESSGRILIEKKEDMRKRGVRSPDLADALAMTFAEYISADQDGDNRSFSGGYKAATKAGY